ncbi:hypothetical protein [Clostridioides sp. ZZV14-6048]|uniref:hypothetical protein n=1 Tax=Clostridioides sp. ZZV14-6048 TaxID=2811490 RepID=UPI001D10543B|nr:hypothetical protein [Clostridioides sp. ZZV14-6048]
MKYEKLYKEYEHIIGGVENYKPIDYDMYRIKRLAQEKERYNKVKNRLINI